MPKFHVGVARFPYGGIEKSTVTDWLLQTVVKMKADSRVGEITFIKEDDTPITMTRNAAMEKAEAQKVDLLLMVDSDMAPDIGLKPATAILGAKPFWETAFDFLLNHHGPAVIAAPYCGPPPWENVYIFRPGNKQSDHPNHDTAVDQYGREDASGRGGIEEVFALPTGLILIDMRCVKTLSQPYFQYEYEGDGFPCEKCGVRKPGRQAKKATTEDVYFSRNLGLAGVKQYVAWDCWAGHWKWKCVGKPKPLTMDSVRKEYRDAIVRGQVSTEQLIMVGEGEQALPPVNNTAKRKK
jgi:hypothetical protein